MELVLLIITVILTVLSIPFCVIMLWYGTYKLAEENGKKNK
jgi:flagellar basal body-associated protein FliL